MFTLENLYLAIYSVTVTTVLVAVSYVSVALATVSVSGYVGMPQFARMVMFSICVSSVATCIILLYDTWNFLL